MKDASGPSDLLLAAALTLGTCLLCLHAAGGLLFLAVSLLVWLAGRALARRLPGLTGDTYGALNELAELSALALAPVCLRLATGLP